MERRTIRIRRGLDVPIEGRAEAVLEDGPQVSSVAVLGPDFHGLKPTMMVSEGDTVRLGQPLFEDKKNPGVLHTAPGAGRVTAIHRGERRALQSVIIELEGDQEETFNHYDAQQLAQLDAEHIVSNLTASGLWTALRARPYSRVPDPTTRPGAIFVTAMDSNPLARCPVELAQEYREELLLGLDLLSRLTEGKVFVCCAPGTEWPDSESDRIEVVEFEGPHPAGLPGTHMHFLYPISAERQAWNLDFQDVIAIGKLFTTGRLWFDRVVTLAGPMAVRPRQLRTRLGANVEDLVNGETTGGACRVIAGSVFGGHRALRWGRFLGRYDRQITLVQEGAPREFLAWLMPGFKRFSATRAFVSSLLGGRRYKMSTSLNGSPRAMVPIGNFERVMPLDMLPAPLLKALIVRDTDSAEALGCLELDEEDLALCSFVCPSKYDYGAFLRETLKAIEKES